MITRTQKLVAQLFVCTADKVGCWAFDVELDHEWKSGDAKRASKDVLSRLGPNFANEFGFMNSSAWVAMDVPSIPYDKIEVFIEKTTAYPTECGLVQRRGRWVSPRNP